MEQILQDFLQLLLLLASQAGWELDLDANNEVTPLSGLLALRHTQVGVPLRPRRPCGPAAAYAELLAIDCLYSTAPAGQGFFEVEFDRTLNIVAFASEERVGFLFVISILF